MMAVETVARAMCSASGFDPDVVLPQQGDKEPLWVAFVPQTAAASSALLKLLLTPSEGMQRAWMLGASPALSIRYAVETFAKEQGIEL